MDINVTTDLTGWLGQTQVQLDACLADLAQVCSATEQRLYADNLSTLRFGITRLVLANPQALGQGATERVARVCFLSAIGHFISFLDKLIASQRTSRQGIPITRAINGQDDLNQYVDEYLSLQTTVVAQDRSLTNPKKIQSFPNLDPTLRDTAAGYFQLRRTLEHHQDRPTTELVVSVRRMAFFVDTLEITQLPHPMKPGESLFLRMLTDEKRYPAGQTVILSPQDAHDLIFTLRNVLAPDVFRAHIEEGRPTAPCA